MFISFHISIRTDTVSGSQRYYIKKSSLVFLEKDIYFLERVCALLYPAMCVSPFLKKVDLVSLVVVAFEECI